MNDTQRIAFEEKYLELLLDKLNDMQKKIIRLKLING